MNNFRFSVQRLSALLICLFLLGYFLIIAKPLLSPLLFACFLSFLLKPMVSRLERRTNMRMLSIVLGILAVLLPLIGLFILIGNQLGNIMGDVDAITNKLSEGLEKSLRWLALTFSVPTSEVETWLSEHVSSFVNVPTQILTAGIGSSVQVVGSILLCLIFIFFLLLYRSSFYQFFIHQFEPSSRDHCTKVVRKIEAMTKEYLNGLLLVMLILAVLNSLGLYIIGIKFALFWGLLGAFLAIIPYVGTTLGGLLPFLYALATFGMAWQPLAVLIFYGVIQSVEGNLITPKIVGNSIQINPFIAILALLIGGAVWGVAGMILPLPLVAMLRIIFANIPMLQPLSELLSDDLYKREDIFGDKYDEKRFRLFSFFKPK